MSEPVPPTPTPPEFQLGDVKQNPDDLSVAVRTNAPDTFPLLQWGCMTVDHGGHYAGWDEVKDWEDLEPTAPVKSAEKEKESAK